MNRILNDAALLKSADTLLAVAVAVRADGILTSAEFPALLIQVEQTKRDLDAWLDEQRALIVIDGAPGMDGLALAEATQ